MLPRKIIATLAILCWLTTLAFVFGPTRWEVAHTYAHLMEEAGRDLPTLTRTVGLPLLGIETSSAMGTVLAILVWGGIWAGPLILLWGIWRSPTQPQLADWLLYGGSLYAAMCSLFATVTAVALWLPFSLL